MTDDEKHKLVRMQCVIAINALETLRLCLKDDFVGLESIDDYLGVFDEALEMIIDLEGVAMATKEGGDDVPSTDTDAERRKATGRVV